MGMQLRENVIVGLMNAAGIKSKAELARRCGMKPQSLNRLLKNKVRPGMVAVEKLCNVLDAQPGAFLVYEPDPPS